MKRNSTLSIVIASLCIIVYLAALVWGLFRVYSSFDERRNLAFKEFYQLVDIAGSAGVLGFMDEPFVRTIEDALAETNTIEALIISGPDDSYAFEKVRGKSINWVNNLPRFKNRFDFMHQPFYEPLRNLNLRNASIEAKAGALDYELLADTLKQTLIIIASALLLAFFTLLCEVLLGKPTAKVSADSAPLDSTTTPTPAPQPEPARRVQSEPVRQAVQTAPVPASVPLAISKPALQIKIEPPPPAETQPEYHVENEPPEQKPQTQVTVKKAETIEPEAETKAKPESAPEVSAKTETEEFEIEIEMEPEPATETEGEAKIEPDAAVAAAIAVAANAEAETVPHGLYTPRGNIGWEAYTSDRLESELQRCASNEQDLVFINLEFKDSNFIDDTFYRRFAEDVVVFFTLRDLVFERGERGISVICPNIDLENAIAKANEFHDRCRKRYAETIQEQTDLCIGISSRAGRLIDAKRLIFETKEALEKALTDPDSHIVAFKSDPEKYRAFIANQNR